MMTRCVLAGYQFDLAVAVKVRPRQERVPLIWAKRLHHCMMVVAMIANGCKNGPTGACRYRCANARRMPSMITTLAIEMGVAIGNHSPVLAP
jgi:hypothetical protein